MSKLYGDTFYSRLRQRVDKAPIPGLFTDKQHRTVLSDATNTLNKTLQTTFKADANFVKQNISDPLTDATHNALDNIEQLQKEVAKGGKSLAQRKNQLKDGVKKIQDEFNSVVVKCKNKGTQNFSTPEATQIKGIIDIASAQFKKTTDSIKSENDTVILKRQNPYNNPDVIDDVLNKEIVAKQPKKTKEELLRKKKENQVAYSHTKLSTSSTPKKDIKLDIKDFQKLQFGFSKKVYHLRGNRIECNFKNLGPKLEKQFMFGMKTFGRIDKRKECLRTLMSEFSAQLSALGAPPTAQEHNQTLTIELQLNSNARNLHYDEYLDLMREQLLRACAQHGFKIDNVTCTINGENVMPRFSDNIKFNDELAERRVANKAMLKAEHDALEKEEEPSFFQKLTGR